MDDQFGLFALPPAPPRALARPRVVSDARRHDLFLATRATAADAARIRAQAAGEDRRLDVGGKLMDAGRLHVSLFELGSYTTVFPQQDVERWMQAADLVRVAPFEVCFDRLATFGGLSHPLVLRSSRQDGVAGLLRLRDALGKALADMGKVVKDKPVEPHMTVSWEGVKIDEAPTPELRWTPVEFVLIDSHVGKHIHEVLASWPLRA